MLYVVFYRKLLICVLILLFSVSAYATSAQQAELVKVNWPFIGILGTVDKQAARRGFQVYKEICSACYSLKHLYYRNLKNLGFSEVEIKDIAKNYNVTDGPNDVGEMYIRTAFSSDKFVSPFPNEQAARIANNEVYPPDLSLIVKARQDGANYVYSLLTHYDDVPLNFKLTSNLYYNSVFPGKQIAMLPPLFDGQITYSDGTTASVEQMARDITIFLQWAAEPEMEHRKSIGLKVIFFLTTFTILCYIVKIRIWTRVG